MDQIQLGYFSSTVNSVRNPHRYLVVFNLRTNDPLLLGITESERDFQGIKSSTTYIRNDIFNAL